MIIPGRKIHSIPKSLDPLVNRHLSQVTYYYLPFIILAQNILLHDRPQRKPAHCKIRHGFVPCPKNVQPAWIDCRSSDKEKELGSGTHEHLNHFYRVFLQNPELQRESQIQAKTSHHPLNSLKYKPVMIHDLLFKTDPVGT